VVQRMDQVLLIHVDEFRDAEVHQILLNTPSFGNWVMLPV